MGEKVNRDVRRFRIRCAEIQENLTLEERRISGRQARIIETLHVSKDYQLKLKDADQTEKDLVASRKAHTGAASISLSSKLNHLRSDLASMEAVALASDLEIKKSVEQASSYSKSLSTYKDSLAQAEQWRATTVDAMRNSLLLRWPLKESSKGLVGKTKSIAEFQNAVERVDGSRIASRFDNMMIAYAVEWESTVEEHEKITTNKVSFHPFVTAENADKNVAMEVVSVDTDPIEGIVIGVRFTRVKLRPCADDPISQLMKAIGD